MREMIAMNNEERKKWGDWSKELYGQEPLRDIGSNNEMMTKVQFLETVRGQTFTIEPEVDERNEVDKLNSQVRHLRQKLVDEQDKNIELNKVIATNSFKISNEKNDDICSTLDEDIFSIFEAHGLSVLTEKVMPAKLSGATIWEITAKRREKI